MGHKFITVVEDLMSGVSLIALVVFLALGLGYFAGMFFSGRSSNKKFAEYEKKLAEQEQKKAELTAVVKEELKNIRTGIVKAASAYENVVNVVEKELGVKEDLHVIPVLPGNPIYNLRTQQSELLPIYQENTDGEQVENSDDKYTVSEKEVPSEENEDVEENSDSKLQSEEE